MSYIEYMLIGTRPKTNIYGVFSKSSGDRLGIIKWYASWRQYCFFPELDTVWSKGCLNEVNYLIEKFMNEWRSQSSASKARKENE